MITWMRYRDGGEWSGWTGPMPDVLLIYKSWAVVKTDDDGVILAHNLSFRELVDFTARHLNQPSTTTQNQNENRDNHAKENSGR